MLLTVVSVKDRLADAFGRPFFTPTAGVAIRSFQDEMSSDSPENFMGKHPDDFDLYELGHFDDSNGSFVLHDDPKLLILGKQAVA